jgi:hydroxymethylglutaryl-CoA lyase
LTISLQDVVYMLNGLGIETGIDMQKLLQASTLIDTALNRSSESKASKALRSKACV